MSLAQTGSIGLSEAIAKHPYRMLGSYRFLLAVFVLISHTAAFLHPGLGKYALGNIGVMLFFVVSGFVILEALDLFYRNRIQYFLINRAFKIYPAYWTATVLMYVLHSIFDVSALPEVPPLQFSAWGIFINITMLPSVLKAGNNLLVISLAWAVLVEFQFYFAAAAITAVARRFRSPDVILLAASYLALAGYLYVHLTYSQQRFFGYLQFAPFFVLGIAIYLFETRRNAACLVLLVVGGLASLHAFFDYNLHGLYRKTVWDWSAGLPWPVIQSTMMYVCGAALLMILLRCRVSPRLEWLDKRLGDLTYAIYLVHLPFIPVVALLEWPPRATFFTIAALTVGTAALVQRFIERPLVRVRNRFRGHALYD